MTQPGTLYMVATPIGNLQDISPRALDVLRTVDLIACEDTRHTLKLLNHFNISNRLISYHEHNERHRADELADRLIRGDSIAVVSDAGMPGISDPGSQVVKRAIEIGADVVPVPGPIAFATAAAISGLPTDSIFFGGFLPSKKSERRRRLEQLASVPATLVFYEGPHRLTKSLIDCLEILGDRKAAVARELTKLYEECVRGSLAELITWSMENPPRGEFVILIDAARAPDPVDADAAHLPDRVAELESSGLDHKAALKQAAREFGMSKSAAYRALLDTK